MAFEGCSLLPVADGSGQLPGIWNGIGAAHFDFFVCEPGVVTQVVVEHVEYGATIGVWEFVHRIDGFTFQPIKKSVQHVATTPETADDDYTALIRSYDRCTPDP